MLIREICLFISFLKKIGVQINVIVYIFNEMLLCFRPRCFRPYLFSRRKPRSRLLRVSRVPRRWPMSSSSCWSCRSRGLRGAASRLRPASSWASRWGSARTSYRWATLACSCLCLSGAGRQHWQRNMQVLSKERGLHAKCGVIEKLYWNKMCLFEYLWTVQYLKWFITR